MPDLALLMADRQGFGQRRQASSSAGHIHDGDGHKVWRTLVCIKGLVLVWVYASGDADVP